MKKNCRKDEWELGKKLDTVEQALLDIRQGKIVMVIDDPDRENEGDFICAAEFATPENINLEKG